MADTTLLLVEDEPDLVDLLSFNLERAGYRVETALTGEDGLEKARRLHPDLVLLDLNLPGMDGLEVCRSVRRTPELRDTPVIMLTARGEEQDIIRGLELGADDYITKPFSTPVVLARVKSVLRRAADGAAPKRVVQAGGVRLDADRHEVLADGNEVHLTATEFKLLSMLVGRPGRVFTRQQIIDTLHQGFAAVTDRSVDVQVVALRRKLGSAGPRIETVRGVGYRFRA